MCARHAGGICEVGSCRLIKIGRVLVLEGTCVNPHCEFIQFIRASLLLTIGSSPRTGQPDRAPRNSSKMATRNKKCSRILEFAMHRWYRPSYRRPRRDSSGRRAIDHDCFAKVVYVRFGRQWLANPKATLGPRERFRKSEPLMPQRRTPGRLANERATCCPGGPCPPLPPSASRTGI